MANPDQIRELCHLCRQESFVVHKIESYRGLTSAASTLDLWNVVGNSLAES